MSREGAHARSRWKSWSLGVVLALSVVVQLPLLQKGISLLDEGSILVLAESIANGALLYRDHATPVGPAIYELLGALFHVFGESILLARLLAAALFSGCAALIWAIGNRAAGIGTAFAAGLAFVALKPLAFPLWTIVNYSQLAMLFCLLAIWAMQGFLVARRPGWLVAASVSVALCVVTKQNLGALMAVVVSMAVALDWLFGPRRLPILLSRALLLIVASAVTVAPVLARYALAGGLDDLFQQAVIGVVSLPAAYFIPLPELAPWDVSGEPLAWLSFTYLPSAFHELILQGTLNLKKTVTPLQWVIKACYVLPLAALAAALLLLVRDVVRGAERRRWVELAMVAAFAGGAYATMLYRADWAHLMNVFPAQIVLVSLVLARLAETSALALHGARTVLVAWLCFGVAAVACHLAAERHPVETPRGTLYGSARQATFTTRVLEAVSEHPAAERIAFLPGIPLYHFLAERRLELPVDLVQPGIVGSDLDVRIAKALRGLDRVVFDPRPVPFVEGGIREFAPATSAVLANHFRWSGIIALNAYELTRLPASGGGEPRVRSRPWARQGDARRQWMFHRVLATPAGPDSRRVCAGFAHTPESGDWLSTTPMFDPRTWTDERRFAAQPPPARITVEASLEDGTVATLHSARLAPGLPGPPLRLPLDAFTAQPIELRLCASALPDARAASPVGWADVRVLAPPAG